MSDPNSLIYVCDRSRHLVCLPYSVENLHRMADELGLKRCWFHSSSRYPHYDMPVKRIEELTSKCRVVSSKELLMIIKNWLNESPS